MRFDDLPVEENTFRINFYTSKTIESSEQCVAVHKLAFGYGNSIDLYLDDKVASASLDSDNDLKNLQTIVKNNRTILGILDNFTDDGSCDLRIRAFYYDILNMGNVEIAINEPQKIIERLKKGDKKGRIENDLYGSLAYRFNFTHGKHHYFLIIAGAIVEDFIEKGESENNAIFFDASKGEIKNNTTNFCVVSNGVRFVASEKEIDKKCIYVLSQLTTKTKSTLNNNVFRLVDGSLKFSDFSNTGGIRIIAKEQLAKLCESSGSYLKKWEDYADKEGEEFLRRARKFGFIEYDGVEQNSDGTVSIKVIQFDAYKDLDQNDLKNSTWELHLEPPSYITDTNYTFADLKEEMKLQAESFNNDYEEKDASKNNPESSDNSQNEALNKQNAVGQQRRNIYSILRYDDQTRIMKLDAENIPQKKGCLYLSLNSETTQIKRRDIARDMIKKGMSANPELGLLIEENGKPALMNKVGHVEPLSDFVRAKVFKNDPTPAQLQAIDIALNTPDIAIIQGPPGTGKTTVIAAIVERLNELFDKTKDGRGRILLTGFQHDAVENMIGRMRPNGLPVPKFGVKNGSEGASLFDEEVDAWCDSIAKKIRIKNPQITSSEKEVEILDLFKSYQSAASDETACAFLEKALEFGAKKFSTNLIQEIEALYRELRNTSDFEKDDDQYINKIRLLRITEEGFSDDGAEKATLVYRDFKTRYSESSFENYRKYMDVLDRAQRWRPGKPLDFLGDLKALKRMLMIKATLPPIYSVKKQNSVFVHLGERVCEAITRETFSKEDYKAAALIEFLSELENNRNRVKRAIKDFSFAYAATCQQSMNYMVYKEKGFKKKRNSPIINPINANSNQSLVYDYVIIDEAARVSPRDLYIPMVQGRRIILVGDHRQLPHIINEEIAESLDSEANVTEGTVSRNESDLLKKSMFEYLFTTRMPELEKMDGIKRSVTLNAQYRMHPLLGDFVSRNFYEYFNPNEHFGSGLPAEKYYHKLPELNSKPAVWIDVNSDSFAPNRRLGTSWIRDPEADTIAQWLEKWKSSEEGKNFSYGVISFYKAQAENVPRYLKRFKNDNDVKIGTVDSFQGMEFDVVFLSAVRTCKNVDENINYVNLSTVEKDALARRTFGHLCSANRLNVSMSRQKKVLVVVGDSNLVKHPLASEYIPGLVNFYKLCCEKGVVL